MPKVEGDYEIIIFGLGRYGGTIGRRLIGEGRKVLGVDFSPVAVRRWQKDGLPAMFGDVSDPELIASLPVRNAQWVISAVPDANTGRQPHDSRLRCCRRSTRPATRARSRSPLTGSTRTSRSRRRRAT
jgi:hypothetical protein